MLSKEQIKKLADLAKIGISEKELDGLKKDIDEILSYVNQLQKIDTKNIEPMTGGTFIVNAFRQDIPETPKERDERLKRIPDILKQFPHKKGSYLKVPKVIEK